MIVVQKTSIVYLQKTVEKLEKEIEKNGGKMFESILKKASK